MAKRPVFIPSNNPNSLVEEKSIEFAWNPGLAPIQKKKNVAALHKAAAQIELAPLLEISTKSEERIGQRLSAFNLRVELRNGTQVPLECAFQGSKVFERGGPYTDLYFVDGRNAKRDPRLVNSGVIIGFNFEGNEFPLVPKTAFYDWIYICALYSQREHLEKLSSYKGFTDIEFNPEKSINCQARSCATYMALKDRNLLDECVNSAQRFIEILRPDSMNQPHSENLKQQSLF